MSHSWGFKKERKKMTEGRRDIKGEKEGVEHERRRGRRCEKKEKIIKNNNKALL